MAGGAAAASIFLEGAALIEGRKASRKRKRARVLLRALKKHRFAQKRNAFLRRFRNIQQEQLLAGSREGAFGSSGFQGLAASTETTRVQRLGEFDDQSQMSFLAEAHLEGAQSNEQTAALLRGGASAAGAAGNI